MLWERVVFGTFSEEMERKETAGRHGTLSKPLCP